MAEEERPLHYVSTHEEARGLIDEHENWWVVDCGCRDSRGTCEQSRHDVCLCFSPEAAGGEDKLRVVSREEVDALLLEARKKRLVPRPFRDFATRSKTDGICFCCKCCCDYFLSKDEICDKGAMVASTDEAECCHCGACIDACYFEARKVIDARVTPDIEVCYGCGVCAEACPIHAIEMKKREGEIEA